MIDEHLLEALRELPPLMPQFLRRRRLGLPAVSELIEQLGLERSAFFTMVLLYEIEGGYGGGPVSIAQITLRSRYIYSTRDLLSEPLAALRKRGLLLEDEEGRLSLSRLAHESVERLHEAARERLAQMEPLPPEDLEVMDRQLEIAISGIVADPVLGPRPGTHLAAGRSLRTFGPQVAPMVRIEQAIYELWLARDDAHIKAWRDAGMEGPPMQVLTLIWAGEATTVSGLVKILHEDQTPKDVDGSLAYLLNKEYIERDGDALALTPAGVLARTDIESETDRIYFNSWSSFTLEDATWLRDMLRELVDNLPVPARSAG